MGIGARLQALTTVEHRCPFTLIQASAPKQQGPRHPSRVIRTSANSRRASRSAVDPPERVVTLSRVLTRKVGSMAVNNVDTVPDILTLQGQDTPLDSLWEQGPVAIVFLRHYG